MSNHDKKHEVAPPSGPKKDNEGRMLAEAVATPSDTAAADKSKRESGKDKEHRKR